MEVIINGVTYSPVAGEAQGPRIGVAVTTHNRPKVVEQTVDEIRRLTPGVDVVVVDDASKTPVKDADYRFEKNVGIARAKNKCLELLYARGCEHFFLFDDDAYPLVEDWWKPYVDSPEPHLMAIFDKPKGVAKTQVETLYEDEQHVAYHATRGYMIYVTRDVLDTVGGYDPAFGKWGWEHMSWSDRIHSAGLTTWRYADVKGSSDLIYSMDQFGESKSTATDEAKRFSEGPGLELRMASRHSGHYVEFRELEDVVITTLLTSQRDPQRPEAMRADASLLKALHDSLSHDGKFVVLHTSMDEDEASKKLPKATFEQVSQQINPYFERWVAVYRYLRDNPNIGRVWCVDGTDVRMLRDPFPEMEEGVLYAGYEPKTLRDEWMVKHHPDTTLQKFMKSNPNLPVVNAGVMGGDRATVMLFAQRLVKMFFDDWIDFIFGWEHGRVHDAQAGDMGCFNYLARTEFADVLSSGPHVTTVFKGEEKSNKTAWWKHK